MSAINGRLSGWQTRLMEQRNSLKEWRVYRKYCIDQNGAPVLGGGVCAGNGCAKIHGAEGIGSFSVLNNELPLGDVEAALASAVAPRQTGSCCLHHRSKAVHITRRRQTFY